MKKKNRIPLLMLAVSFIGFSIFYFIPFVLSFGYALIDNPINAKFVGVQQFIELFKNQYFLQGLGNTVRFMVVSIPLNMFLSLLLALGLYRLQKGQKIIILLFLIPLVIPSATTAFFWEKLFAEYGVVNHFLQRFGIEGIDWFQSKYGMIIVTIIFLWKNIGYNMILFISALHNIPEDYYEYAKIEGANKWQCFYKITFIYLQPTMLLCFIMTFVNSFKVFKEIYIITGEYPAESLYILQHYMNNMFLALNYPKLVSSSYVVTAVIVVIVLVIFRLEHKISRDFT